MIKTDDMSYMQLLYLISQGFAPAKIRMSTGCIYYWALDDTDKHKYLSTYGTSLLEDMVNFKNTEEELAKGSDYASFEDQSYYMIPANVYNDYINAYENKRIAYIRYNDSKATLDIITIKAYNGAILDACQDIKHLKVTERIITLCPHVWYNWDNIAMK